MGNRYEGQLGDGSFDSGLNQPFQIVSSNVISIGAARNHGLFVKNDGSLWAMGENLNGQLGDGNYERVSVPELIVSNVTTVAGGMYYSLFLKSDGSLWAMGDNNYGCCPSFVSANLPVIIVSHDVTAIAAGEYHALFLKNDGSLWGIGDNVCGQLGTDAYRNAGKVGVSCRGYRNTAYALDLSYSLFPANWVAQATNKSDPNGVVIFTNTPSVTTNNFCRIRSDF